MKFWIRMRQSHTFCSWGAARCTPHTFCALRGPSEGPLTHLMLTNREFPRISLAFPRISQLPRKSMVSAALPPQTWSAPPRSTELIRTLHMHNLDQTTRGAQTWPGHSKCANLISGPHLHGLDQDTPNQLHIIYYILYYVVIYIYIYIIH